MNIIKIEIPEYLRKVELSRSRNQKYYVAGKNTPKAKKYLDKEKYDWKKIGDKTFLVDLETNEKVIANPKAAGTPRNLVINGQKIYNGEASKHIRNKVLSAIKESFSTYINKLSEIKEFPLTLELEIHDVIRENGSYSLWDIDNRSYPYIKAFQDCLTGNKDKTGKKRNKQIIPDDNILFITQPPVPKFIPVDDEKDRKLVFIIKKETDKRILNHKGYKQELKQLGYEI